MVVYEGVWCEIPKVRWGIDLLEKALKDNGIDFGFSRCLFSKKSLQSFAKFKNQGYQVQLQERSLLIESETSDGALYALIDIYKKISEGQKIPENWMDAPCMEYRGYTVGLQKQKGFYPDHKYYDWPITSANFPWLYNRVHLAQLLDRLALQRCNVLVLWSSHPFASLVSVPEFPEALEVSFEELAENQETLDWLIEEAEKRGIYLFFHFYNIHMPDLLAKSRGWSILNGVPHPEICDYTKKTLKVFVHRYPKVGFLVCAGEVLEASYKLKWLKEIVLPGILSGVKEGFSAPQVVLREHGFDLAAHYPSLKQSYPNLCTMMKYNSECLLSTRPSPENRELVKRSDCHFVNIHLAANLEPFSWGAPGFIQECVQQMVRQDISGLLVYPLRFWDWPNSSHIEPCGNQLYEHFIWWNAWGRYAWNPFREVLEEKKYWEKELSVHYAISNKSSGLLLQALEKTGPVLPELASQFMISSGNRQSIVLGEFLLPLGFSRLQYQEGSGYSMSQLIGFPLLGEQMWSCSPIQRMEKLSSDCLSALKLLKPIKETSKYLMMIYLEIEALFFILEHYRFKAIACAFYFHDYFGVPSKEKADQALTLSLEKYRQLVEVTRPLFCDAGSLYVQRLHPLPAEEGYLHWKDCLPAFEKEFAQAKEKGIRAFL